MTIIQRQKRMLAKSDDNRFLLNRQNGLTAGNDDGSHSWAYLSSLLTTCKLNNVNPEDYLADVLTKIANDWPQTRIDELLPFAYAEK